MEEGSKTLLKGLLVLLTLALGKEHLLDMNEANEMLLVGAMTVLTMVFSHERFVGTIKDATIINRNINENFVAGPVFTENTLNAIQSSLSQLTQKETDVLSLIAKGLINKDIAKKLAVSESTVRTYLNSVLRKLNASLTTNVVLKAVRHGFVNVINTLHSHQYYKGSTCFYKPILCQEGWCSECIVYRERAIESSTSFARS